MITLEARIVGGFKLVIDIVVVQHTRPIIALLNLALAFSGSHIIHRSISRLLQKSPESPWCTCGKTVREPTPFSISTPLEAVDLSPCYL